MKWKAGARATTSKTGVAKAVVVLARPAHARLCYRGLSLGTVAIALIAGWIFGINPPTVLGLLSGGGAPAAYEQPAAPAHRPPANDRSAAFVRTVLADTEDVWAVFKASGKNYERPTLVLFSNATPTACGQGEAAAGPFYCPGDHKVYIDLGFFETLRSRLGAPGDFAQAYVIAHEVGHHVQNLMGVTERMDRQRDRVSEAQMNALSVRVELQADLPGRRLGPPLAAEQRLAGEGRPEEALNAATQIGDDTLQRNAGRRVVPESFTHGSSEQRMSCSSAHGQRRHQPVQHLRA